MLREAGFNWQHSTMQPSFCVTNIGWSPQYWAIPLLGPTRAYSGRPAYPKFQQASVGLGLDHPRAPAWYQPCRRTVMVSRIHTTYPGQIWIASNDGKSATYSLQLNLVNIFPPLSTGGWRNKYVDRVIWHCGICIICDDALWGHPAPWLMHAIHIDLRTSWPSYHSYLQQCLICGLLLHLPQRQIITRSFLFTPWPWRGLCQPPGWISTQNMYTMYILRQAIGQNVTKLPYKSNE